MTTPENQSEVYSSIRRNKQKCVIVDIDGTVVDVTHRLHHIKNGKRNWKAFWAEMHNDSPVQHVIDLVNTIGKDGIYIAVVTARDEGVRAETKIQLRNIGLDYDCLRMRAAKDFRKDEIVKLEIIRDLQNDYDIMFALEDRDHNVKAFRENGINCLQVTDDENANQFDRDWNGQTFLTVLIGPSGAGKSTYSNAHFNPKEIISSDEVREALTVWKRSDSEATWAKLTNADHTRTWEAVHDLVETRLRHGMKTCLDATNISRRDRMEVLKHVPVTQRVKYVIIDRPLEDKIASKGWRSEELVKKHHASFQASKTHALKGDDQDFVDVEVWDRLFSKG